MERLSHPIESEKQHGISITAASTPSSKHPEWNEDAVGFNEELKWAAIFDGVGGGLHGDLASQEALQTVTEAFASFSGEETIWETREKVEEIVLAANDRIQKAWQGMSGTTAVVAKIAERFGKTSALIASVGDSRAYLYRKDTLIQITTDDSHISSDHAEKIDNVTAVAELTQEEYASFRKRNMITQYLGDLEHGVHMHNLPLFPHDTLILTTDGVHDNLTKQEIQEMIAAGCEADAVVEAARSRSLAQHFRSKPDDISAVIIRLNEQ